MRTTITLDPDTDALVKRAMRDRGLSFKDAVNEAIRTGLGAGRPAAMTRTHRLGFAEGVPYDKALRLAADLEDEVLARRVSERT